MLKARSWKILEASGTAGPSDSIKCEEFLGHERGPPACQDGVSQRSETLLHREKQILVK